MEDETPRKGQCFNCKKDCAEGEYCFGCKSFVCEECDKSVGLFGSHHREKHLLYPEDDE